MRKVIVTQEHIDNGKKFSTIACPIAIAIKPFLKSNELVKVGFNRIEIYKGSKVRRYFLPLKAQQFIENFDNGLLVAPFSFYLRK